MTKDMITEDFQEMVDELLTRNRSLLDVLSKLEDTDSKVVRAITKSVTHCGCLNINASKQEFSEDAELSQMHERVSSHVGGALCPRCREKVEEELGAHLFYIASACNALDLSLYDVILKERNRLDTLGRFHMR